MIYHFLRDFHNKYNNDEIKNMGLGDYILLFFSFYYMNGELCRQTINVKTGAITNRQRKPNTFSMLSPLD